ncbi:hypothetical protein [Trinickia sp. EG282A]|uniref:hypothetical protein n=1 Tax=Trinickia sp. EG282A TaxID=3237013 RepID=UPI0034D30117
MQVLSFIDFCALAAPVVFQELPRAGSSHGNITALSVRGGVTCDDMGLPRSFVFVRALPDELADKEGGGSQVEWPLSSYRDGPDVYEDHADRQFLVWDQPSIERLRTMLAMPDSFFERAEPVRLAVE